MKSIMFLLGNSFVSRNYLSTPLFEKLLKIKESHHLNIYFVGIESNPVSTEIKQKTASFLSSYGISYVPVVPEKGYFSERLFWKLRQDYIHRSSVYRFNELNSFITHKRYKDITSNFKNSDHKLLWNTDVWPKYLGFPFPRSNKIFNFITKMLSSKIISGQHSIRETFQKFSPNILFIGDTQTPLSFTYALYGLMYKSYVIGNVRTWDHLTKNGPLIPKLSEYWVWNNMMKKEMTKFHHINPSLIKIVGSPQFDNYFNLEKLDLKTTLKEKNISLEENIILFGANRYHRGIGEPSIAKHIAERIQSLHYSKINFQLVIRSHPMDKDFENRFRELKEYPFVKLIRTPDIDTFDPVEYKKDGYLMASILSRSKMLICGQSTLAIDASCTDTPIINIAFEGKEDVPDLLSVRNRYQVNHYQDLLRMGGTTLVSNFDELDKQIINYLNNPELHTEGRKNIREQFAGNSYKQSSSEKIIERLIQIIEKI